MITLITGASHVGKTVLAQRMLEKYNYPYMSMDHLKMGLIRGGYTNLTPQDDDKLTEYMWPMIREIIKTAIENKQDLVIEGCYVPVNWRDDFDKNYLENIDFICLAMTEEYIDNHPDEILGHESDVEKRLFKGDFEAQDLKQSNRWFIENFGAAGEKVVVIDGDFEETLAGLLN